MMRVFGLSVFAAVLSVLPSAAAAGNLLLGDPIGFSVAVDSSSGGYSARPLTDGIIYTVSEERAGRSQGALGNADNAWHSREKSGAHWVELFFHAPRPLAQLDVWWGPERLWPRAVRLEAWEGGVWRTLPAAAGGEEWRAAAGQHTRFSLRGLAPTRLRIVQRDGGGGAARPAAMCAVEVAVAYAEPDALPALCRAGAPGHAALAPELSDERLLTYVCLSTREGEPRLLEFQLPVSQPIRQIVYDFIVFGGGDLAPVGGTQLELHEGSHWRIVSNTPEADWSEATSHGPAERLGRVRWIYTLAGEPITGARLTVSRGPGGAVVCCGMGAYTDAAFSAVPPAKAEIPAPASDANLLEIVACKLELIHQKKPSPLRLPSRIALGPRPQTLSLCFPSPKMISSLRLATTGKAPFDCTPELWLEGEPVRIPRITLKQSGAAREWSLSPRAVERIDFHLACREDAEITIQSLYAGMDAAGLGSLKAIETSRRDLWGEELLAQGEPDYLGSAALMLPRRECRTVHGAPDDEDETVVNWNGTHLLRRRDDPRAPLLSRFLAFRLDGHDFGENYDAVRGGWTDGGGELRPGGLPERWLRYEREGVACTLRSFTGVTEEGKSTHLLHLELLLESSEDTERRGVLEIATGLVGWSTVARFRIENQLPVEDRPSVRDGRLLLDQFGRAVLLSDTSFVLAGTESEPACRFQYALRRGRPMRIQLRALVDAPGAGAVLPATPTLSEARATFRRYWQGKLFSGLRIRVPDKRLAPRIPRFLADCLITPDRGKPLYGSYYYESYFGVEEGWPILALARYGLFAEAQVGAERMLEIAVHDRTSGHRQYRKGLAPTYAWGVYELCRDAGYLARIYPAFQTCAEETISERAKTKLVHDGRPVGYYGLLPKLNYGGDVRESAYGLYANACAWRGLCDTARTAAEIGDAAAAERYRREAQSYRADILCVVDRIMDTTATPPFVPFSLGLGQPADEPFPKGDPTPATLADDRLAAYWNLFAGLILESRLFPPRSAYTDSILETMRQRGGLWDGQARFGRSAPDWDPHYGYGLHQMWCERGDRDLFLLAFYGFMANNMSRDSWVHAEVSSVFPLRTDNFAGQALATRKLWRLTYNDSEPIGSGAGILLSELRDMLLCEGRDETGGVDGSLHLLRDAPRAWLESGEEIAVENAPTAYGRCTLRARGDAREGVLRVEVTLEAKEPLRVRVHAGPLAGRGIARVAWKNAQPLGQSDQWCEARLAGSASLEVRFAPSGAPTQP